MGQQLWKGALLLCDWLIHLNCRHDSPLHNAVLVELGGGVGLVGIIMGLLPGLKGAVVTDRGHEHPSPVFRRGSRRHPSPSFAPSLTLIPTLVQPLLSSSCMALTSPYPNLNLDLDLDLNLNLNLNPQTRASSTSLNGTFEPTLTCRVRSLLLVVVVAEATATVALTSLSVG